MKLFEEKYGTLEYDSTVPCITATFKGFMSSEQFRDFLTKGLQHLIEKRKLHNKILWLADTRKHVVQPDKDTLWVAEEWTPKALKGGIGHVAFVLPENVFGDMSVKKYAAASEKKKNEMIIEMFGDPESAKKWFKSIA